MPPTPPVRAERAPGDPAVVRYYAGPRYLGTWVPKTGWWFMPGSRGKSTDPDEVLALFVAWAETGFGWVTGGFPGPADARAAVPVTVPGGLVCSRCRRRPPDPGRKECGRCRAARRRDWARRKSHREPPE